MSMLSGNEDLLFGSTVAGKSGLSILLAPYGSRGDVEPFLRLGRILRNAGAKPTFLINPYFAPWVSAQHFSQISVGSAEGAEKVIEHPLLWDRRRGFEVIARSVLPSFQRYYQAIAECPQRFDLVVSGSWNMAAAAYGEAACIPHIKLHVTPAYLRSSCDYSLLLDGTHDPLSLPPWMRSCWHWYRDRSYLNQFLPKLNSQRGTCGLAPVRSFYQAAFCPPGRMVLLFPSWFAPSRPDWPAHEHLGFLPSDMHPGTTLPLEIEEFLSDGDAPVLWTFGSLFRKTEGLVECARQVSARLGLRAIFLGDHGSSPVRTNANFIHASYLPFGRLLPRCKAIVHHGGIGTMSAAIEAELPQLAVPIAHDQPDNAFRMVAAGLGYAIPSEEVNPSKLALALQELIQEARSAGIRARCRTFSRSFSEPETLAKEFLDLQT